MSEITYGAGEAAPAQLASALLEAALSKHKSTPAPASSGSDEIDSAALYGGFRYGEITSIAGASGMGKTLIALHALASHLLQCKAGDVAFIDSTGSFSPVRLRDVILVRLKKQTQSSVLQQSGYMYEKLPHEVVVRDDERLTAQANEMLDRVRVMRVFDFAGLVEAIGEVSETCERIARGDEEKKEQQQGKKSGKTAGEILDSQDEDEDDGNVEIVGEAMSNAEGSRVATCEVQVDSPGEDTPGVGMIVVDTVTNVVSSMMGKSQVQGHALVTTLVRSLRHLCSRHRICALLVNSAVGLDPSSNPTYQRRTEDNASAFESTAGKPALGKTFSYLIDTSVYLSKIPKTKEDAEIAFGDSNARKWNSVGVFEVLKDKYGTCEGQWTLFRIDDGVSIRSVY